MPICTAEDPRSLWATALVTSWCAAAVLDEVSPDDAAQQISDQISRDLPRRSSAPITSWVQEATEILTWPHFIAKMKAGLPKRIALVLPVAGDTHGLPAAMGERVQDVGAAMTWARRSHPTTLHIAIAQPNTDALAWSHELAGPVDNHGESPHPIGAALDEADRTLKRAVLAAAERLDDLELIPTDTAARDGLAALAARFDDTRWPGWVQPAGDPRSRIDVAMRAMTIIWATQLALASDGPALSATAAAARASALTDLGRHGRRGLEAAFTTDVR
ncbi:MAG: hypothetical protein ACYYNF_04600 [Actinomycetes bacterium]